MTAQLVSLSSAGFLLLVCGAGWWRGLGLLKPGAEGGGMVQAWQFEALRFWVLKQRCVRKLRSRHAGQRGPAGSLYVGERVYQGRPQRTGII